MFGKYAILTPVTYHMEKEPTWFWKINPTTIAAEMEVAKLLGTERTKTEFDGLKTAYIVTTLELAMREIAVTFGGTNIPGESGPVLKDDATIEQIETVLGTMPREMILEIWNAVGDACPGWGPVMRRKSKVVPTSETGGTEEKK